MSYVTLDENGDLIVKSGNAFSEDAAAMISSVRAHAEEFYSYGAWDILVHCWNDEMIYAKIKDCLCDTDAIKRMRQVLAPYADWRSNFCGEDRLEETV